VQRYSLFLSLSLCFCGASCHYLGDHQNPATRLLSLALSRVCVRERERERQKRRASKVRAGDPRQSLGGGASFFLCFAGVRSAAPGKQSRPGRARGRERERGGGAEEKRGAVLALSRSRLARRLPLPPFLPSVALRLLRACAPWALSRETSLGFFRPAAALWHLPPQLFAVLLGFAGLALLAHCSC
jgi:hypothetical protein